MKTSYYSNLRRVDLNGYQPIAISADGGKMVNFSGRAEISLSPYAFFKSWKLKENKIEEDFKNKVIDLQTYNLLKEQNQDLYIKSFYNKVLKGKNPQQVYEKLGKNAVLVCFEKPTDFCHRFLVASWLELNLGVEIDELGFEDDVRVKQNKEKLKQKLISVINNN